MNLLSQLQLRLNHAHAPDVVVMGADLVLVMPSAPPPATVPERPPIAQPATVRRALADWWYTVAYHKGVWSRPESQAAYKAIRQLRIQYYGPQGWAAQPGWWDLTKRAERELRAAGVDEAALSGWLATAERWLSGWSAEWEAADYGTRVAIGQAWQTAYTEGLKEKWAERAQEAAQEVAQHAAGFGAGAALAVAGVALVGAALLFPDQALNQVRDTAGRYQRLAGR